MDKKALINKHKKIVSFFLLVLNKFNPCNRCNRFYIKSSKNNSLQYNCSIMKNCLIKINGKNNRIIIYDFSVLSHCHIIINGDNNTIVIGEYCNLNQVEFWIEDNNNEIVIGKRTSLCGKTHLSAIESRKIIIGESCLFSSNIDFRTSDSHSIVNMNGERINPSEDILIGNHVWIGTKVTCLKGVIVADNCIVAATSTLCKKYTTPNCVGVFLPKY
jgi:acetyltransferase-like isoleucine patch superfamily enzyme